MDIETDAERSDELTVHLSSDAGLLALVAPSGLVHRFGDHSWWTREDELIAEANAGHVVPIDSGEGGFAVRVTFEALNERERRYAADSAAFWLRVPDDEEVAMVAGEELAFPDTPGAATFWTSPGTYHVTVTRLRWTAEPDDEASDALPDYIVRLRPFRAGEEPPTIDALPQLRSDDL